MKKVYNTPVSYKVDLCAEAAILANSLNDGSRFDVSNESIDENQILSNRKDMWGKEGIWD